MDPALEDEVAAFVGAYGLIRPQDRVLAAVSGGADSMAMLHALNLLRQGQGACRGLVCAHINHRLRGPESEADESFVRAVASRLDLPFVGISLDVTGFALGHGLSIETAARVLRMQALQDLARQTGCNVIALGHQKNDNAETLIHRLIRGTGLRGMAGIWPLRPGGDGLRIIRPLLCVTRQKVLEFLAAKGLSWQEDSTNADCRFTRNAIRRQLLPVLQEQAGSPLVETLSALALAGYDLYATTILPAADRLWPAVVRDTGDGSLSLDIEPVKGEPPYVQVELIRRALTALGCGERDLAEVHYAGLLALIGSRTRARGVSLPEGFLAHRHGTTLQITREGHAAAGEGQASPVPLPVPGQARMGSWLVEAAVLSMDEVGPVPVRGKTSGTTEWLDYDRLRLPLRLRPRRTGDRFHPLGQAGDKKVARFLIDARIGQPRRDAVIVVEDQERIVWVCPVRISDLAKVTGATRRVVRLNVRPAEDVASISDCGFRIAD
jgi:tRNA(Ile)-lysidine synthase